MQDKHPNMLMEEVKYITFLKNERDIYVRSGELGEAHCKASGRGYVYTHTISIKPRLFGLYKVVTIYYKYYHIQSN